MLAQVTLLSFTAFMYISEARPHHFPFAGFYPSFGPPFGPPFDPFRGDLNFRMRIPNPSAFRFPYPFYQPEPAWFNNFRLNFPTAPHKNEMFSKKLDFFIPNDQSPQFRSTDGEHIESKTMEELEAKPGETMVYKGKDKETDADVTVYKYKSGDSDPDAIEETAYVATKGPLRMTGFKVFHSGSKAASNEGEFQTNMFYNDQRPLVARNADFIDDGFVDDDELNEDVEMNEDAESNNDLESNSDLESNEISPPEEDENEGDE